MTTYNGWPEIGQQMARIADLLGHGLNGSKRKAVADALTDGLQRLCQVPKAPIAAGATLEAVAEAQAATSARHASQVLLETVGKILAETRPRVLLATRDGSKN